VDLGSKKIKNYTNVMKFKEYWKLTFLQLYVNGRITLGGHNPYSRLWGNKNTESEWDWRRG
jgi:hypothetical protein